jgi:hypothetical protein
MFKLNDLGDERGISEVLGAILVIGMVIAVGSVFYGNYVQSSIHTTEASFMNDVRGTFIDLQSAISAMGAGQWKLVRIPMNVSFPALVPTSGEVGTVSVNPGQAYLLQSGSVQNLVTRSISGSLGGMENDNDNSYLEINQVIFSEKFPNMSSWQYTNNADFDITVSHTYDTTGSIRVLSSAGGIFPSDADEDAYWDQDLGDSLEDYPNVTLRAWFGKSTDWTIFSPSVDELWRIDVENGGLPVNQTLYAHRENTPISGTYYNLLKTSSADNTGTNLSASTDNTGRKLLKTFVYQLTGLSTIPASTWTFYYNSWFSTVPSRTENRNPSSFSGGWVNPINAENDGGGYASITSGTPSASENYYGYGFNIPVGSAINQVRVRYDAWTAGLVSSGSITLRPNAAGDNTSIAGVSGAATHWQAENTDDNDTSYVYENDNVFHRDLYNLDNTAQTGTITSVVVYAKVSGTDNGTGVAETSIKTGGTTYDNTTAFNVTASYQTFSTTYENNPESGVAWTWDNITSLQAGVLLKRPGGVGTSTRATYVWVVVNYTQTQLTNDNIRVYVSGDNGISWSSSQVTSLTSSENTYWDNVTAIGWKPENFNGDNFRVRIDAYTVGTAGEVRLDWIPVEVTYTPLAVAQASVDILVRHDNGAINDNIASDVAISDNLTQTATTLSKNYAWAAYTVENQKDYLEIDYYVDVTTAATGENAYLKIDNNTLAIDNQTRVTNVLFVYPPSWNTGVISYGTTDEGTNGAPPSWIQENTLPNPIKNKVNKIRVYMCDNLSAGWLSTANAYVWTDEITMWAGPPFLNSVIIGSKPIMNPQGVDDVVVTLGFWSKDSPSMENLYIKNFSDNQWETLENGIVKGDNKVYWVVNIGGADNSTRDNNPSHYIDENSVIWLNMVGENNISPFRLVFDYVNFQVNYENQYKSSSYEGYYGGSGKLVFHIKNYSYSDQTYIYDDGAVIVVQGNSSSMISEPPLTSGDSPPIGSAFVNVEKGAGDDDIVVTVNHFVLMGSPASVSKGGYSSVRASVSIDKYTWITQENENVYINIPYSSDTANAWTNYLSEIAYYLNSNSYFNSKTGFSLRNFIATANGLTLAITHTDDDNNRRIHYSETVTEIGFSLA